MEKNSYEIGLDQDRMEKELQAAINSQCVVEEELLILQKQIIELQSKKKDLELTRLKSNQNIRVLQSRLRVGKSEFFRAKEAGI